MGFWQRIGRWWCSGATKRGVTWAYEAGGIFVGVREGALIFLAEPGTELYKWMGVATGCAFGSVVVIPSIKTLADEATMIHELTHVRQAMWLGPSMDVLYRWSTKWATWRKQDGHYGNWFEKQAYRAEKVGRVLNLWE